MSIYKHVIGDPLDSALFSSTHESGPVRDGNAPSRLHHGAVALPLEAEITGKLRCRWPQGNDVMNASHTSLLHYVLSEVNAYRSNEFATSGAMKTRGERLAWAREQAGYGSKSAAARALQIPVSTYNSHERAEQPGGRDYSPEEAESYARLFKVALGWLITGRGDPKAGGDMIPTQIVPARGTMGEMVVAGTVEAGSFREADEEFENELPAINAPPDARYPDARQMAFKIVGDSMDRATPPMLPGGYALCVDYDDLDNRVPLRDGLKVVIERTKFGGQMRERSVKEVEIFDDRNEFHPRSSNPKHRPIVVFKDHDPDDGEEVRILALVRGVYYHDV